MLTVALFVEVHVKRFWTIVCPFCTFGLCYYPGDRRMSRFQWFQDIKNDNIFYGLCSFIVFTTDFPPVSAVNLQTNDSIYYMESHLFLFYSIFFFFFFFFIIFFFFYLFFFIIFLIVYLIFYYNSYCLSMFLL
jgi:hypothetical protein